MESKAHSSEVIWKKKQAEKIGQVEKQNKLQLLSIL